MLLEALAEGVTGYEVDDFYYLARAALVKDEKYFDTYDKVFANFFQGAMNATERVFEAEIPADWLKQLAERVFDEEELKKLEAMSFREMMEELAKRLDAQQRPHHGGDRWIGTGGTSPFGNAGRNPAGVRIGGEGGGGRATKVWEKREFRALDGDLEIGTRNFKVALRKLRKFAREGAEDEFDLDGTIRATADNAGYLDIKMIPERKNRIKVLLFIDVGGSMDSHVRISEELFSAARSELKHLEYYYFHNFPYERVWQKHRRGYNEWGPDLGNPQHLRAGLQGDLRRRCDDEPLRNHGNRWLDRALERGGGRAVAAPAPRSFRRRGVAQSRAVATVDGDAIGAHYPSAHGRPHVPVDARGTRRGDQAPAPRRPGALKALRLIS